MNTSGIALPCDTMLPGEGLLFRASRSVILFVLWLIYTGSIMYFNHFSGLLLYGTYAVLAGCILGCLSFEWTLTRNARPAAPYLLWLAAYFLWGMFVITNQNVMQEGAKTFAKNVLVLAAVAVTLERTTLRSFANIVQAAVLFNLAVCAWEVVDPTLVTTIALTREIDGTSFNPERPAGLWSNPDEGASALIFALLISRWATGPLAWLGRVGALAALYLAASRTGAYLAALCVIALASQWLTYHRIRSSHVAGIFAALLLLGAGGVLAMKQLDLSQHWQVTRFLDFAEQTRGLDDESRVDIARKALDLAIAGGWTGHGLFTFQGAATLPSLLNPPAHNVFLAVWGEAGPLVGAAYLLVLGFGIRRVFQVPLLPRDRLVLVLMWVCYLLIGLTWHNQFTSFAGMLYIALLFLLPAALENTGDAPECGTLAAA